nr:prepilin-type N-terminal cleavage/methylation domain-containing protein [uncultured Blautia sp.]
MFKLLNKKKNNKGFTLVELVIVIAILALLVGLLAPQYTKYVEKSRKSADVDNMNEMVKAVQVYAVDKGAASGNKAGGGSITLSKTGVTVDGASKDEITAALTEYVPNYSNIALKSKQWGTPDPTATFTIDADGGVKVELKPDTFAEYSESKKETPTTNTP